MGSFGDRSVSLENGSTVRIRSAKTTDAAAMLVFGRAVLAEGEFTLLEPDELPTTVEDEASWIRDYADSPGRILLVAELADAVIGVLGFETDGRRRISHRGTLHVAVAKAWRGQGMGRALMECFFTWAQTQPTLEKVCLGVFHTNTIGRALYASFGFVEEGRSVRSVRIGPGKYVDEILMARFIDRDGPSVTA